jgi:hypothetical protein
MGPLEINAFYRQQQLLDEARENGLARSARRARSTKVIAPRWGLLSRIVRSRSVLRQFGAASARGKASV